jgi:hypothetical protein
MFAIGLHHLLQFLACPHVYVVDFSVKHFVF